MESKERLSTARVEKAKAVLDELEVRFPVKKKRNSL